MEDELKLKEAFAQLLARTPAEPFVAGLALFPNDTNRALWAAYNWPNDEDVKGFLESQGKFKNTPEDKENLRAKLVQINVDIAENNHVHPELRIKATQAAGEIAGITKQKGPEVVVNNTVANKVMAYRDFGTDDEWEVKAQKQQRELQSVSESRH